MVYLPKWLDEQWGSTGGNYWLETNTETYWGSTSRSNHTKFTKVSSIDVRWSLRELIWSFTGWSETYPPGWKKNMKTPQWNEMVAVLCSWIKWRKTAENAPLFYEMFQMWNLIPRKQRHFLSAARDDEHEGQTSKGQTLSFDFTVAVKHTLSFIPLSPSWPEILSLQRGGLNSSC